MIELQSNSGSLIDNHNHNVDPDSPTASGKARRWSGKTLLACGCCFLVYMLQMVAGSVFSSFFFKCCFWGGIHSTAAVGRQISPFIHGLVCWGGWVALFLVGFFFFWFKKSVVNDPKGSNLTCETVPLQDAGSWQRKVSFGIPEPRNVTVTILMATSQHPGGASIPRYNHLH